MESTTKDNMIEYLNDQLYLTKHQHGFVSNRSCLSNFLEALESWTVSLDNPDMIMIGVDIVHLDYQKAFDRVPHKRLLQMLKAYGIEDCHMTVSIRGQTSDNSPVYYGVPQGSVIVPIFLVHM